jgi:hypothetical protein
MNLWQTESYFPNKSASRVQPLVSTRISRHRAPMPVMIDIVGKALYFNLADRTKPQKHLYEMLNPKGRRP